MNKKNILIVFGIILFVTIIGHILSVTPLFENLELTSYDIRSRFDTDNGLFGNKFRHADKDIVIVAIDNASLKELSEHQDEWEENVWKNVIHFIEKGEPKAVLFNMVFEKLNDEPWYNRTFADSLTQYNNVILGTYLDKPILKENNFSKKIDLRENDYIPTYEPLNVTVDNKKLDKAITYTTNSEINRLYKHNTIGVINSVLDADSVVRKNQPIFKMVKQGQTYYMPSLAFAGFLKYMGEDGKITIKNNKILFKSRVIPIDNNGVVNISRHKVSHNYSYIPISKILLNNGGQNELKPEFFKDKLVIIGKTATGGNVNLSSIISSDYAGPEATAIALDNFINDSIPNDTKARKFVYEMPKPIQFIITVAACLIVALLVLVSKSAFIGCINGVLSIFVYIFFCFWLFANPNSRVWLPIIMPIYYLTLTSGIVFAFKFYKETIKKNFIMDSFGRFVSPKILHKIIKNPNEMVLKSQKKHLTVLFCDVKDFSMLSEKYEPEKLIENLNELFKEIVNIVFENNGTVDKFIGDCIMAYWGADEITTKDHAFLAVKTALEIKKKINELKITNAQENKIIFDVKIGINTGEALLGLTGADRIMCYTAMGEPVNTASRMESACSFLNRDILISKSTLDETKNKIIVLSAGEISIKGKLDKMQVFEPIGLEDNNLNEEADKIQND